MKYQLDSSCVIMSLILMTTLFCKALILQGEIWRWSLLGLKGLKKQRTRKTHAPVKNETPEMCALHKKRDYEEDYEQVKVTHIFRSVHSKAVGSVDSVLFYSYFLDCNVCCCQRFRCEAADLGDQLWLSESLWRLCAQMWVSNARCNPVSRVELGGVAARINKSSQVNFSLDSHVILLQEKFL